MLMKTKAFTLIEMVIVLLIMGVIVMLFASLTGNQIQRLHHKTVKEQILSSYQLQYSKNLTSSIFGGVSYETMKVTFTAGEDAVEFSYDTLGEPLPSFSMREDFVRDRIITHPYSQMGERRTIPSVTLTMTPYHIACSIGETLSQIVLVAQIKEQDYTCFEISSKTCRMREVQCMDGVRIRDT